MKRIPVPVGSKFGDWETIEPCFRLKRMTMVLCRCDCGAERTIHVGNLRSGKTLGCGCKHGARIAKSKTRHGLSDTSEHLAWINMRKRCADPKDRAFKNYGGRGIFVCERWANSFDAFISDMGMKPTPKHSIERINNDGPYSLENCRWATSAEQNSNKRNNLKLIIDGEIITLAELSQRHGINIHTLQNRYYSGRRLL